MKPKPYDLKQKSEINRLLKELKGYMRVSLHNGTDSAGRQYAYDALCEILHFNYSVYIDK